ncbi:UNVERIFIED_ORG: hypothetical protein QE434_004764 [Rhizobium sp. SORGH_AS 755]|nr:hypothetical protein [Rhizobium sp. SORGH_AS_0755]
MPLSYAHSSGDGSNRLFDVPCEYLSKAHVTVRVDGVLVPFSWIDTYRLQTTTAPPSGSVVEVRRVTPRVDRLVTFTDGSTLVQSDLNTSTLQSFFLAQEAFDQGAASMAVTEDGQFSALNRRITSLANPVNAQDAVTKLWAETAMSSQLVQATQKALDAATSAAQSEASAVNSDNRAAAALTSKNAAAGSATAAAQSEANAIANKNQTQLDRAATAADRVQTGLDREASAASAAAAKKSAQDAALFDPSSYYTKTETDNKYLTSATAQTDFYTKTQINTTLGGYYTKSAVDTALNLKVNKTGDTLTGNLTLEKTYPLMQYSNGGNKWWTYYDTGDGSFKFSYNEGVRFQVSADGHIWCAAFGNVHDRIEQRALAWANDRVVNLNSRWVSRGERWMWQIGTGGSYEAPAGAALTGIKYITNTQGGIDMVYFRYFQLFDPVRGWITAHYA